MPDTAKQDEDQMIDPVTGEIIDQKELAEQLLARPRSRAFPWSARGLLCGLTA